MSRHPERSSPTGGWMLVEDDAVRALGRGLLWSLKAGVRELHLLFAVDPDGWPSQADGSLSGSGRGGSTAGGWLTEKRQLLLTERVGVAEDRSLFSGRPQQIPGPSLNGADRCVTGGHSEEYQVVDLMGQLNDL